jgi:hypothetical protein
MTAAKKSPKKARLRKVVDNEATPPSAPQPSPHSRKANCIFDLGPVWDYAYRLVRELGADEAVAQGQCGVRLIHEGGKYDRSLLRLSWPKEIVRDAKSPLLSMEAWKELATPRLWPRKKELLPTEAELKAIIEELQNTALPQVMDFGLTNKGELIIGEDMPPLLKLAPDHKRWVIKRREDKCWIGKCVVVRFDPEEKPGVDSPGKKYITHVKLSDGRWIAREPDVPVPLYGLEELRQGFAVMIHEGPRKAQMARQAAKDPDHPWADILSCYTHVAWITGAHRAAEVDWQELMAKRPRKVVICADNDDAGRAVAPVISQTLSGVPLFLLQFDDRWPESFDPADPFPDNLFKEFAGERRYIGPSMYELLIPATWATRITGFHNNGAPMFALLPEFARRWRYIQDQDRFVHLDNVARSFKPEALNNALAPFAHPGANIARLLSQSFYGSVATLAYAPDQEPGIINVEGKGPAINQFRPSLIRACEGDVELYLEFLKHLFPVPEERHEMDRWADTIIAHPEIHMTYGILLYSKMFGVGKGTWTDCVLMPLVGTHNTSFPSEAMVLKSEFNAWLVNQRLIVVPEIYSGHGWQMFNRLKTYVSDKTIQARLMFMNPYVIDNWAHFAVCTNFPKALILAREGERRWLVPTVTEEKLPWEKARRFRDYLKSGGLEAILDRAKRRNDYINEGEEAPETVGKAMMREAQLSDHMLEARELAVGLAAYEKSEALPNGQAAAMDWRSIQEYLVKAFGLLRDDARQMRAFMEREGVRWTGDRERVFVGGLQDYVLLNAALETEIEARDAELIAEGKSDRQRQIERADTIRKSLIKPGDLLAF